MYVSMQFALLLMCQRLSLCGISQQLLACVPWKKYLLHLLFWTVCVQLNSVNFVAWTLFFILKKNIFIMWNSFPVTMFPVPLFSSKNIKRWMTFEVVLLMNSWSHFKWSGLNYFVLTFKLIFIYNARIVYIHVFTLYQKSMHVITFVIIFCNYTYNYTVEPSFTP